MQILTRRAGLTGALLIAALSFAACGGGSTATSTADATPPTDTPAPSVDAGAVPSEGIALPTFDLSALAAGLENVDSYRITISTGGDSDYQATVVTKPVLSRDVTAGDQRFVIIGDEAWIETDGQLVPAPAGLASGMLSSFDPVLLVGAFAQPGAMFGASELGSEEKNGVQAKHFKVDSSSLVGTFASMPPGSSIEIWIAEDGGYLVSLSAVGLSDSDFQMDVTNVNDPANVVERPG
jgi:hypothetical protein